MSSSSYRQAGHARVLVALVVVIFAAPLLFAPTAGAAPPPGIPAMRQTAELVSIPFGSNHRQGREVALSADGSTLAVTAVRERAIDQSAVVVYVRSGERWLTQAILREPPDSGGDSHYWAEKIAISADGGTLAVTDSDASVLVGGTNVLGAGMVHLFTRVGQTWRAADRLVAPQPQVGEEFGLDVSVSGDGGRVTVTSDGAAYIADVGSRGLRELPLPAGISGSPRSVAISPDGRTVVVGAPSSDLADLNDVLVLVDDPASGWTQRWRLREEPSDGWASFGSAVAVNDTGTVVVGSPSQNDQGVYVFDRRGAALVRTAKFSKPYRSPHMGLGRSVALSADGSTVVAGAPWRDAAGGTIVAAGAAYRWVRSPGGWSWGGLLAVGRPHTYEFQGMSTAVSGDGRVVVVGASHRSSARLGVTGAAMVYGAVP